MPLFIEETINKQRLLCEKQVKRAVTKDATVKFFLDELSKKGCSFDISKILCAPCGNTEGNVKCAGSFNFETAEIKICDNVLSSQDHVDRTLAHELIHAFDHCRAYVEEKNALHQACTEIRAHNLSNECRFFIEFLRTGKLKWKNGQKECVRRRALLSLYGSPHFSRETAEKAVNQVFEECYQDTTPFSYMP